MVFVCQEHDLHRLFSGMFETNDAVASLTTSALENRKTGPGGEGHFARKWNDGFGADYGRSRGDPRRRAIRPIEASKAAIRNGCFTSTLDVAFANGVIRRDVANGSIR